MAAGDTKTATKIDVSSLSPAEREEVMRELLGADEYQNLMVLKAKSQTKEQKKVIKTRARQLVGAVKDVAGDAEFSEPYNTAKAEMNTVFDRALIRSQTLIEQEEKAAAA